MMSYFQDWSAQRVAQAIHMMPDDLSQTILKRDAASQTITCQVKLL